MPAAAALTAGDIRDCCGAGLLWALEHFRRRWARKRGASWESETLTVGTCDDLSDPEDAVSVHSVEKEPDRASCWIGGSAELRLMELHQEAASGRSGANEDLQAELASLFEQLPNNAVPRVRAAFDGGLVFDPWGRHVDLRSLVFSLHQRDRLRVLVRIHSACPPVPPARRGFVVLSDVDDTVLPGRDLLKVSGSDRSWVLDGRLYPGVAQMHSELRGDLGRDRDYPVLLTARPPPLVRKLPDKLADLTDDFRPRMAILPGVSGLAVGANLVRVLCQQYSRLGHLKVKRMIQYAWLFPDYAGRFVFIGDDGQGDLGAVSRMLALPAPRLAGGATSPRTPTRRGSRRPPDRPLLAFAAIHAVRDKANDFIIPKEQHQAKVAELRSRYPPYTCPQSPTGMVLGERHRFFYFLDYADLARQLAAAGWISPDQQEAVQWAHSVESSSINNKLGMPRGISPMSWGSSPSNSPSFGLDLVGVIPKFLSLPARIWPASTK